LSTGFLINKRDKNALAEKIQLLLNDVALSKKMGKTAQKVFHEKYTLGMFEKNMLQAFDEIIKN